AGPAHRHRSTGHPRRKSVGWRSRRRCRRAGPCAQAGLRIPTTRGTDPTMTDTPSTAPPPITALQVAGLTKVYGAGTTAVTALDAVDLTVPAGTFTAVMGPSGSGKSTLLHCMAGLDRPTAGTVTVDGHGFTGLSPAALTRLRRTRIGLVFQDYNLLPTLSVLANVTLPMRLAGTRIDRDECRALLDAVGLAGLADRRPGALSGGQQQRVAIARA